MGIRTITHGDPKKFDAAVNAAMAGSTLQLHAIATRPNGDLVAVLVEREPGLTVEADAGSIESAVEAIFELHMERLMALVEREPTRVSAPPAPAPKPRPAPASPPAPGSEDEPAKVVAEDTSRTGRKKRTKT